MFQHAVAVCKTTHIKIPKQYVSTWSGLISSKLTLGFQYTKNKQKLFKWKIEISLVCVCVSLKYTHLKHYIFVFSKVWLLGSVTVLYFDSSGIYSIFFIIYCSRSKIYRPCGKRSLTGFKHLWPVKRMEIQFFCFFFGGGVRVQT